MTIPEEQQAAALRRLADALAVLQAAQDEVDAAAAHARDVKVSINRIGKLANVSRDKVLAWIERHEAKPPQVNDSDEPSGT